MTKKMSEITSLWRDYRAQTKSTVDKGSEITVYVKVADMPVELVLAKARQQIARDHDQALRDGLKGLKGLKPFRDVAVRERKMTWDVMARHNSPRYMAPPKSLNDNVADALAEGQTPEQIIALVQAQIAAEMSEK